MIGNLQDKYTLNFVIAAVFASLIIFSGCSSNQKNVSPIPSIDPQVKANLSAPVDCSTARRDIKVLEDEKASVGKQVLSGVRSILPISAVAGLLMGDYSDRVEVASGEYNSDIEAKIKQIKAACYLK